MRELNGSGTGTVAETLRNEENLDLVQLELHKGKLNVQSNCLQKLF